jgi:hypothetical protein
MQGPLRISALVVLAVALTVVILIPGLRGRPGPQGSEVFALPTANPTTFAEYLGRLATLRPPSRNARPDGYIRIVGLRPIPIFLVNAKGATTGVRR